LIIIYTFFYEFICTNKSNITEENHTAWLKYSTIIFELIKVYIFIYLQMMSLIFFSQAYLNNFQ